VSLHGSYHLSNLFFKSHKNDLLNSLGFNTEQLPINDQEGSFYSNLSNPSSLPTVVNGAKKNVSWWNVNLGINILLGSSSVK
jgi:hypothetical protein